MVTSAREGVRWIDTRADHNRKIEEGQKMTTPLLICPNKAMQEAIVRKGIVIGHEIKDVRLYSKRVNPLLCFNCGEWGHARLRCSKKTQCGNALGLMIQTPVLARRNPAATVVKTIPYGRSPRAK
jgi:hypothetical protein